MPVHCDFCGEYTEDCWCSQCPTCHTFGNPQCHEHHHMNIKECPCGVRWLGLPVDENCPVCNPEIAQ